VTTVAVQAQVAVPLIFELVKISPAVSSSPVVVAVQVAGKKPKEELEVV
jgi:Mg/Co/Ni transporter MgtE